jgi:hypothetical protein
MGSALTQLGLDPLDVTVVSDIGCCGLVDGLLNCHTVHGLHGRAVALATGIRFGIGVRGKVIAVQGDGGATIGLQHLLEAARRNVDITVIVQNNMVYGMTGGQLSGLSPRGFKARSGGEDIRPYDICELAAVAGAPFVARAFVGRDTAELWTEAIGSRGFSLIEIVETCPAYGIRKVKELESVAEYPAVTRRSPRPVPGAQFLVSESLFEDIEPVSPRVSSTLHEPIRVNLAGSAGEGVQSAGQLLATAGMIAGLHAAKKGEYPITVGTGFSVAEVILSPNPIRYAAIDHPHVVIAVSENGLRQVADRVDERTALWVDDTLRDWPTLGECTAAPFRKQAGAKGAAIAAIAIWLRESEAFPLDALIEAIRQHPHADKLQAAIDSFRCDKRE